MSEKGIKVMLSKDKLSWLKFIDLDFCEDCVIEMGYASELKNQ